MCDWLAKYSCNDVCMESTGKYWIPVFNVLEKNNIWVTLSHPKYTKPQKGNKTDRKDAKWICDLYMCEMVNPSFIPPADIRELRDMPLCSQSSNITLSIIKYYNKISILSLYKNKFFEDLSSFDQSDISDIIAAESSNHRVHSHQTENFYK